MKVEEYRSVLQENVQIAASANLSNPHDEFLKIVTDIMSDAEEFDDFTNCHFEGISELKHPMRIDGYSMDETDGICSVFISNYYGEFDKEHITIDTKSITDSFEQLFTFIGEAIRIELYKELEESTEAYEFARTLYLEKDEILSFRLYLLTDAFKKHEDIRLRSKSIHGKKADCEIWDIQRIFNVINSTNQKDSVEIDLKEMGFSGIPCVKAVEFHDVVADIELEKTLSSELKDSKETPDNVITYSSYLAVVPGPVLHDLYHTYGSKLLEGNVRSFLSAKGKVNKSIQRTIIHYPEMFFAYNNGIAATASDIETQMTENGLVITKIKDLQIVNGGQTTASITNTVLHARSDEHVDLNRLFVPMKVSVLEHSMSEKIIPKISEYSNSQNKVDASDFFSNHPFHKRMEDFSRKIAAPIVNGNQFHQYWYYERMRGQYLQGMMKFKAKSSELAQYEQKYPKNQVIKMVDLAKYMEIYDAKPHIVSKGKQALVREFSAKIKSDWEKSDLQFNAYYFRRVVGIAIMFNELDEIVKNTRWYQVKHSYKANIVAYTLSLVFEYIRLYYPGKSIDFPKIWDNQTMYDELQKQVTVLAEEIYSYITRDDRPKENVTEWCKDPACWKGALQHSWSFSEEFENSLISESTLEEDAEEAKKTQKVSDEVDEMEFVLSSGPEYWTKLLKWASDRKLLTEMEESIIQVIIKGFSTGKLASEKQVKVAMKARKRLIENDGMPLEL